MGWLDRLFGHHDAQAPASAAPATPAQSTGTAQATIPPERVGYMASTIKAAWQRELPKHSTKLALTIIKQSGSHKPALQ